MSEDEGSGEILWGRVSGIFAGVQNNEWVKESVAVLLNDVWNGTEVEFILWTSLRCMLL